MENGLIANAFVDELEKIAVSRTLYGGALSRQVGKALDPLKKMLNPGISMRTMERAGFQHPAFREQAAQQALKNVRGTQTRMVRRTRPVAAAGSGYRDDLRQVAHFHKTLNRIQLTPQAARKIWRQGPGHRDFDVLNTVLKGSGVSPAARDEFLSQALARRRRIWELKKPKYIPLNIPAWTRRPAPAVARPAPIVGHPDMQRAVAGGGR